MPRILARRDSSSAPGASASSSSCSASPAPSRRVSVYADPSEQGATLGAAQAFGSIGRMRGPEAIVKAYDVWGALIALLPASGVMGLPVTAPLRGERERRGLLPAHP